VRRERRRHDDRHTELLRHALDARRFVRGRPDDGELQALRDADVAVRHVADVQADAMAQLRQFRAHCVLVRNALAGASRGRDRVRACRMCVGAGCAGDGKDREHRIADVAQDLAAVLDDRTSHRREEPVEVHQVARVIHRIGEAC
jgi:hypothetical protein